MEEYEEAFRVLITRAVVGKVGRALIGVHCDRAWWACAACLTDWWLRVQVLLLPGGAPSRL